MSDSLTMLLPRWDTSAPARTTKAQDNPTLLFSWWCTCFAMTFIIVRLCGRMIRNNQLFNEDKIMFASIIPLLARMALVHVVLIWGTNNAMFTVPTSQTEISHRAVGSRLVLAARIFYAMFIWLAKLTISEFLRRLTATYWKRSYELTLRGIRYMLLFTFIAVVIATLAECQPFDHYWQVLPDPGPSCRLGYAQLITMGTADMLTDALLIIFPVTLVIRSPGFTVQRKMRLVGLFSLSAILMGVTGYRIKSVIAHHGKQQYRTVYASGEILGAAAVANAVVIGSFLRDRGVKKQKFKYNSTTDSMERPSRRNTRSNIHADDDESDDDLFHGMCYRSEHDPESPVRPRAAPMALPISPGSRSPVARRDSSMGFRGSYFQDNDDKNARESEDSDNITAVDASVPPVAAPELSNLPSPRRQRTVSFCDVGGLLEDASSQSSTLAPSSPTMNGTAAQDFARFSSSTARRTSDYSASSPRRGSHALLSILSPILQAPKRGSNDSRSPSDSASDITASGGLSPIREPTAPVQGILLRRHDSEQDLQDVGGLLSVPSPSQVPLPASRGSLPSLSIPRTPSRTPSPRSRARPSPAPSMSPSRS